MNEELERLLNELSPEDRMRIAQKITPNPTEINPLAPQADLVSHPMYSQYAAEIAAMAGRPDQINLIKQRYRRQHNMPCW